MFSASRGFGHCLRLNCGHPLEPRIDSALATLGRIVAQQLR
jgi:DNA-binding transcriptional MocR family regulator